MTKPANKIRVSSLTWYPDCPLRGAVNRSPEEFGLSDNHIMSSVAASIGTGFHAAAAHVKLNDSASLDDMQEVGIGKFRESIHRGVEWDSISPNANSSEKQIKRLSQAWFELVAPKFEVLILEDGKPAVEKLLEARINDDYYLSGHPDFICENPIIENKTGQSVTGQAQLGGYSKLVKANNISNPTDLIIHLLKNTTIDKPVSAPVEVVYDVDMCEQAATNVIDQIVSHHSRFKKTGDIDSFPVNPQSMLCSKKYCKAYGKVCPIMKGA